MEKQKRKYLSNGTELMVCDKSDAGDKHNKSIKFFTITGRLDNKGEGASGVCYEADNPNSGPGVLKEYYPTEAGDPALKRLPNGQLVPAEDTPETQNRFRQMCNEYVSSYQAIIKSKRKYPNLATFILPLEVYFGCDADGNEMGTAYIWMSFPKLETFEKICEDIHHHPAVRPEYKLYLVLQMMKSLTECIRDLHKCGLVHRDIKPSNFGFVRRGDETRSETIMFHDVDSVCEVDKSRGILKSNGFLEPEAETAIQNKSGSYQVSNQTDIYSIGAVLFYAVIITDSTKENGYLYKKENYSEIEELVQTSELIAASEANSHPKLRYYISMILKKCLCGRKNRYTCCEELLTDIKYACFYATPPQLARKNAFGDRWILADAETNKYLDAHTKKNSTLAIQYHLYEHPLYESLQKIKTPIDSKAIQLLIFGFGDYGQKYLDACLAVCQIPGYTVRATVVPGDVTTENEIYLARNGGFQPGKDSTPGRNNR